MHRLSMISTSIGIRHQTESRDDYLHSMAVAVEFLVCRYSLRPEVPPAERPGSKGSGAYYLETWNAVDGRPLAQRVFTLERSVASG
jgi:hypothetical protein